MPALASVLSSAISAAISAAASLLTAGVTYAQPAPPPSSSTAAQAEPLRVCFDVTRDVRQASGDTSVAELHAALLRTTEQRLSAELGRPVVRVSRAECGQECLYVELARATVTERFVPASGEPRQRTIDIAGDATLWPDAVALLAGNLVRDEAASLLATLPADAGPLPIDEALPPGPPPPPASLASLASGAPPVDQPVTSPGSSPLAPSGAAPSAAPALSATAAAPSPVRPVRHSPVSFGLVPLISTDWVRVGGVRHDVSLDLVAGISGGSRGLSVSGAVDIELGPVSGLQLAGAMASAEQLRGAQFAGAVAYATEIQGTQIAGALSAGREVRGLQIGGAVAIATRSSGSQAAGAAVLSGEDAGAQIAGALSMAGRDAGTQISGAASMARRRAGLQIAGALNVAGGNTGTQISGAVNVSGGTTHTQVAGALNIANKVEGVQIGTFNIAKRVEGVQVGVVNIGGGNDGVSLGLLNIVPGGRTDLEASLDSEGIGTVMLRHGSRRWHNVYGVGGQHVDADLVAGTDDVWMYGLGFGPSWQRGETLVDVEAMAWQVNYGDRHSEDISLLAQLRVSVAHDLGPVTLVGGGAVNTFITNDQRQPFLERQTMTTTDEVETKSWLSAFVGVRL